MELRFGNILLAAGTRTSSASPLVISTAPQLQFASRVRAATRKVFNRQNYGTDVSFGVDLLQSSLLAAEVYVETIAELLKGIGKQDLKMTNSGAGSFKTLKNAMPASVTARYRGLTVHVDYTFSGENIV